MNKYEIYKKNLKEYNNFKETQQNLKEKHNITSDKIIVEKSNTIKFLITSALPVSSTRAMQKIG